MVALPRVGVYASAYGATNDNQARVPNLLWNSGWAAYLASSVTPYLQYGYRRLSFRSPFGENTIGTVFGQTYTTTASPTPGQCVANMLGPRHHDDLLGLCGFTTDPADGRLLTGFEAAWLPFLPLLDEIIFYHTMPPNGVKRTGSLGGTPTAWTNSVAAFDNWDREFLNLSRASSGAMVSIGYDSSCSFNTGSVDRIIPANNALGEAFLRHVIGTRTHRVYLEPHPERNVGGTNLNTEFVTVPRVNIISVSSPILASDVARRPILHPLDYYGPDWMGGESVAWLDGTFTAAERVDMAMYFLDRLWSVFVEPGDLNASQHRKLIEAGRPIFTSSKGTGISRRHKR